MHKIRLVLLAATVLMLQSACSEPISAQEKRPVNEKRPVKSADMACEAKRPPSKNDGAQHTLKRYSARVVKISDGDTVQVTDDKGRKQRVRLAYIDAPELAQAGGEISRRRLQQVLAGKQVSVQVVDIDQYRRQVALLRIGKQDINAAQLENGMAWHYDSIAKRQQSDAAYAYYRCLQSAARRSGAGLWQDKSAQAPWNYRREHRQ